VHADEAKLLLNAVDIARDDSAEAVEHPIDRVDGLLRVADGFLANPEHGRTGGDRTQLVVTVGPSALGDTSAQLAHAPLSAATLARVACDASLTVVKVDADGDALSHARSRWDCQSPARVARFAARGPSTAGRSAPLARSAWPDAQSSAAWTWRWTRGDRGVREVDARGGGRGRARRHRYSPPLMKPERRDEGSRTYDKSSLRAGRYLP